MEKEIIQSLTGDFESYATEVDGVECWYARDLQPLLGYDRWENFFKVKENMGISLNYTAELKSPKLLSELLKEVQALAREAGWKVKRIKPQTFKVPDTPPLHGEGVLLNIHPECELVNLVFDSKGKMASYQWLELCRSFEADARNFEKYFKSIDVSDDSDYWETGEVEKLVERMNITNAAISRVKSFFDARVAELKKEEDSLDDLLDDLRQFWKRAGKDLPHKGRKDD